MADRRDPNEHGPEQAAVPSGVAAVRPQVRREDENTTMINVMNARGPRPQSHSWAMTLCMGAGVVILILAIVQLLG